MIDQSLRFGKNPTGQRREDRSLLTGQGNFTDDIACPGQLHAAFVRSPHAHARISRIDVSAALGASGVVDVFSGDALVAAGVGHIPMAMRFNNSDGSLMALAPVPVLPHDRVRYVGEAIAIVIAETVAEAHDETVTLSICRRGWGGRPRRSGGLHRVLPYGRRLIAELPHRSTGDQVALDVEGVVDGGVGGEEALR
jgi:hypothetical protein